MLILPSMAVFFCVSAQGSLVDGLVVALVCLAILAVVVASQIHAFAAPLGRFVTALPPVLRPRERYTPFGIASWLRVRWPQDLRESLAHTCGVVITLQAFEALIVLNPPIPPPRTLHPPPRGVPGTVRIFLPCIFPNPDLEPNRSPTALAHHRNLEDRGWTLTYDRRVGLLATLHITQFDDPIVHATTRILPDLLSILYVTQAVPAARLRALAPLKELAPA